jgi:c-di-GMP-binding flagellar brake protein YcgR
MTLQTLLTSKDDSTAEMLIRVLAELGVAVDRSTAVDVATSRLQEERFDQVIVDFDDSDGARLLLEACRDVTGPERNSPVTVALVPNPSQIRSILGAGAHFVLVKPVTAEQAKNTFRTATAVLRRERRMSFRVAVQAPISIRTSDGSVVEGILLDLSKGGLDVLAANPLPKATGVKVNFEIPNGGITIDAEAEVAWSNANGQVGLRFLNMTGNTTMQFDDWLTARSHEALPDEPESTTENRLTDLSLGGCYVETESPFPQNSAIDLCLADTGMEIKTAGLVRVMHPGHGMGIEFSAASPEQRRDVGQFIEFLTIDPAANPKLEISPRALVASTAELRGSADADSDDALLELLRDGSSLEQDAFLNALREQRTALAVSE